MTDKCSCGARDKSKCSKENGLESGKMCLKDFFEENPQINVVVDLLEDEKFYRGLKSYLNEAKQ